MRDYSSTLSVFIKAYKTNLKVGIHEFEKDKPQPVLISVELETSINIANVAENIDDTVSYEPIVDCIRQLETGPHIQLIETIAEKLTQACFQDPHVKKVTICVEKTTVFSQSESCGIKLITEKS